MPMFVFDIFVRNLCKGLVFKWETDDIRMAIYETILPEPSYGWADMEDAFIANAPMLDRTVYENGALASRAVEFKNVSSTGDNKAAGVCIYLASSQLPVAVLSNGPDEPPIGGPFGLSLKGAHVVVRPNNQYEGAWFRL